LSPASAEIVTVPPSAGRNCGQSSVVEIQGASSNCGWPSTWTSPIELAL